MIREPDGEKQTPEVPGKLQSTEEPREAGLS